LAVYFYFEPCSPITKPPLYKAIKGLIYIGYPLNCFTDFVVRQIRYFAIFSYSVEKQIPLSFFLIHSEAYKPAKIKINILQVDFGKCMYYAVKSRHFSLVFWRVCYFYLLHCSYYLQSYGSATFNYWRFACSFWSKSLAILLQIMLHAA
jgi:hypothetical protein